MPYGVTLDLELRMTCSLNRASYLLIHVHVYEINKYEIKLLLIFAPDGSEATISPVRVGSMWSIVWEATA
jgi:hypothetical protein